MSATFGLGISKTRESAWVDGVTGDGVPFEARTDGTEQRVSVLSALLRDGVARETLAALLDVTDDGTDESVAALADGAANVCAALGGMLALRETVRQDAITPDKIHARRTSRVNDKGETVVTYRIDRARFGRTAPLGVGALADALTSLLDAIADEL